MPSQNKKGRRTFSTSQPYRIHIENETKLMPVFTVYPNQYEAALKRYPDLAKIVKTTWGIDGDVWNTAVKDADALIGYRFPRENLAQRAPNLELVQVLGAGVDYMLPFDWVPKDLVLTTNCGAHVPKASQSALMAILMANAQLPKLTTAQRRREWMRIFTPTVAGKTILIVGVGHIGGGAAEQAKKLGMRVLGIRRSKNPHPAVEEMHGADALHQLLPKADIVLLNTSLTSTTRFLFSREEFHLMKPGAAFINMSRGGLVDPKALEEALRTDRIGCAIIDVTFPEPLPTDSTLWDAPNLIITPHVLSDDLDEYIPRTLDIFFDNVRRHMAGEPFTNIVDIAREY
jgi:phosphoglycerate dehydrogenase-like enzyme